MRILMRRNASTIFVVLLGSMLALAACGDDDSPKADAASNGPDAAIVDAAPGTPDAPPVNQPDAEPVDFALTSTAFNQTDLLADKYTCAGANVSPPLAWTEGPAGTLSYAIVFTDLDNGPFVHSVIWDIPAAVHALPEHVENVAMPSVPAGAKQAHAYDGSTFGYLGPCPGGNTHHYEFELYAIDVATMPNLPTSTGRNAVVTALGGHKLASVKLGLISNASN
jgi:Raf kinase inhibitor-like YbhB/YbcL family protein